MQWRPSARNYEALLKTRYNSVRISNFGLKFTTLQRHVNKYEKLPDDGKKDVSYVPRYNTKEVFTAKQELSLKNYLITSAKIHFGLTRITFAKFAYSFAVVNSITVPDSWKKTSPRASIGYIFFLKRF